MRERDNRIAITKPGFGYAIGSAAAEESVDTASPARLAVLIAGERILLCGAPPAGINTSSAIGRLCSVEGQRGEDSADASETNRGSVVRLLRLLIALLFDERPVLALEILHLNAIAPYADQGAAIEESGRSRNTVASGELPTRFSRGMFDLIGGADRDQTDDLLSAISAFVSRHTRTPPDSWKKGSSAHDKCVTIA